jgi:hypothetical protein
MDFGDNVWEVDWPEPDEWSAADSGKIASMSRTETSSGGPLFTVNRLDDAVDIFDGESA